MAEREFKNLVKEFDNLLLETKREGMEDLISFLKSKTDFYEAPASTRFHNCHKGGLLEHSLNVYKALMSLKTNKVWQEAFNGVSDETLVISTLLHDLCKTNMYILDFKNTKVYSDHGMKRDQKGRYDWEAVECYSVEDQSPYGHGEKSVMIASEFIKLSALEKYMIRWHMGFTEPKENWNYFTNSLKKFPLVLAIHQADLMATYLLEKEE